MRVTAEIDFLIVILFLLLLCPPCAALCTHTYPEPAQGQGFVNLLLNWGPIIYLPGVFIASWMLTKANGLRKAVLLGATLCFTGACLRAVPTFLQDHTTDQSVDMRC